MLYPKIKAAVEHPTLLDGETSGVARFLQAILSERTEFIPRDKECAPSPALTSLMPTFAPCDPSHIHLLKHPALVSVMSLHDRDGMRVYDGMSWWS